MAAEDIQRKAELACLAAFYAPLLTDKQLQALTLHCEEDMSLGEIAGEMGISRQGVHELLSRAADKLLDMEGRLHMARRFRDMEEGLLRCRELLGGGRYREAGEQLDQLIRLEQEDGNGL